MSLNLNYFLRAPISTEAHCEVRASTYEIWRYTNIQSITGQTQSKRAIFGRKITQIGAKGADLVKSNNLAVFPLRYFLVNQVALIRDFSFLKNQRKL